MKHLTTLFLALTIATSCINSNKGAQKTNSTAPAPVEQYTYKVINTYPHSETSYTQGLVWDQGQLWEGTGQYELSALQKVDLGSGEVTQVAKLPDSEFGEGIAVLDSLIYQLTWHANKAYVYNKFSGKKVKEFRYLGEGWGITNDDKHLYMSSGTDIIYKLDPQNFNRLKRISVTYKGEPMNYINEMEWIDGKIWANVYTTDMIAIINPESGVVEALIDLTGILPQSEMGPNTDVLNGIAYDKEQDRIFVTGKNWSKLFEIEIIKQ